MPCTRQPSAAGAWLVALVLLASRGAIAAPAPRFRSLAETIRVQPGVTCLDEVALREQVRSWLDSDAVDADLRVEVEGSATDGRFVSIRILRGDRPIASRHFAPGPSNCEQLHAVVGLAVALALKVSLHDELFGESVPAVVERWSLGAAAIAAWDVIPGAAGGLMLWFEQELPQHFAARFEVSGLTGGGGQFRTVSGEFAASSLAVDLAGCAVPVFGARVRGRFCTGLEARTLFATGSGFAISKDAVLDWFSLATSAGVAVQLAPHWSLLGMLGLVVPLQNVDVSVAESGGRVVETRTLSPAGGLFSLGSAYRF